MNEVIIGLISKELSLDGKQVRNTVDLLENGATIPFISRYRKELTGSLDEVQIASVKKELDRFNDLIKRKETILKTIGEQEKLTDELKAKIDNCWNGIELEDIYLPYKPKRKTRAVVAREKGLEPLAKRIMLQTLVDLETEASRYVNNQVASVEEALQGAKDIIAEWVNENAAARTKIRRLFEKGAWISSKVIKGKEEEGEKYKDYFEYEELLKKCPSHRLLAIRRGETEGFLKLKIEPDPEEANEILNAMFVKGSYDSSLIVEEALADSYKRLIAPSIENEFRASSKLTADEEAIKVFVENLRQLLLAPPLGQKRVLAIDPGYRTGCKIVCLDDHGNLLHNETIYPHPPQSETKQAKKKIASLVDAYQIDAIAIGNGTAGRETEHFVRTIQYPKDVQVFVVSEAGASVYSASKVAREEFPEYDVTVRGSVSIGRRLMDPLAELVKIDAKSIGVGQYQHDVDQNLLKGSLDRLVESCVNLVGVNLNTASKHLLTYVSGLGPALAQNIVDFRKENGRFVNRNQLKKVPRMGAKAFEQAAGFLRIRDGENPLDNTAVHPESYPLVQKMAKDLALSVNELIQNKEVQSKIVPEKYISKEVGLPTLKDILNELAKPGRDPRSKIKMFEFSQDVFKLDDLKVGMVLPGIVTNITKFGAFVDVGVKQDGLVHISQMADRFISDPNEIVKLHEHVKVKVVELDLQRKRIQLSLKEVNE